MMIWNHKIKPGMMIPIDFHMFQMAEPTFGD
jgi:hypothetical protein